MPKDVNPLVEIDTQDRDLTAEHLALLMAWAKSHWFASCACLEAPCELVDTANGVALLIESHARATNELRALRDRIEAVAAKCDEIPQWRGTVPQAQRFRELLEETPCAD